MVVNIRILLLNRKLNVVLLLNKNVLKHIYIILSKNQTVINEVISMMCWPEVQQNA